MLYAVLNNDDSQLSFKCLLCFALCVYSSISVCKVVILHGIVINFVHDCSIIFFFPFFFIGNKSETEDVHGLNLSVTLAQAVTKYHD